jgi:hypothetical protein
MEIAKSMGKWFSTNWERMLFAVVGLAFLGTCFYLLYAEKVTEAAVVFGLGFLSFIYANVARFKRFKGLGFEAELWEDKQKEAADLIERLREIVSIYTREVILGKVTSGRSGVKVNWENHWKLYNDLVTRHTVLGQKIDFSDVKRVMDDYFLFDMTWREISKIEEAATKGKGTAMQKINQEFGSSSPDSEGYKKRLEQYDAVQVGIKDHFRTSTKSDLAGLALNAWHDTKERLRRDFDVEVDIDPRVHERLEKVSRLYQSRPVQVTNELIGWANGEG